MAHQHQDITGTTRLPGRRIGLRWWPAAIVVLGAWELSTAVGIVSPLLLPRPVEVVIALGQLAASGELWLHLTPSLLRVVAGLMVGSIFALAAGTIARRAGVDLGSADSRLLAGGAVAAIVLVPLFNVWFGYGSVPIIAATACAVFMPMARTTNIPGRMRSRMVGPEDVRNLQDTSVIAIGVVAVTEMIAAEEGIGRFILDSGQQLRPEQMLAGFLALLLVVVLLALVLRLPSYLLQRRQ